MRQRRCGGRCRLLVECTLLRECTISLFFPGAHLAWATRILTHLAFPNCNAERSWERKLGSWTARWRARAGRTRSKTRRWSRGFLRCSPSPAPLPALAGDTATLFGSFLHPALRQLHRTTSWATTQFWHGKVPIKHDAFNHSHPCRAALNF